MAASSGTGEGDLKKLCDIIEVVPDLKYICIDVANGYSEHFVQFVRDVRKKFPKHTIMVGTTNASATNVTLSQTSKQYQNRDMAGRTLKH